MRHFSFLALLLLLLCTPTLVLATRFTWNSKEFMGMNEIKPGMTGYGKTVFQGTTVETFGVKVIGVLRHYSYDKDMILIQVTSGPPVTHKMQSVAGMSGSPIYINGRLIGAYAYGFAFQNEPVSGVTPIAEMLDDIQPGCTQPVKATLPQNARLRIGHQMIAHVQIARTVAEARVLRASAGADTLVGSPVATPLIATGIPARLLKPLQQVFAQYNLELVSSDLAAGGGGGKTTLAAKDARVQGGSALAVSLLDGDWGLSAVGTVTYVKGDTLLAFGHPFTGMGDCNFPMSLASITHIISSAERSMKLGVAVARVGTLVSDRNNAVCGILGKDAHTIPIIWQIFDPSRNMKRYAAVQMVNDPRISPTIFGVYGLVQGLPEVMGDTSFLTGTFTTDTVIETDKLGTQRFHADEMVYGSMGALGGIEPMAFLTTVMDNPYDPVAVKRITFTTTYHPERNYAVIERAVPDRQIVRPGDTVNFDVSIRRYGKPVEIKRVSVQAPANASEPVMLVMIAGGNSERMVKPLLTPPTYPEEGVRGYARWFTKIMTPRALYTLRFFPSASLAYHGKMLRDLPLPLIDLFRLGEYIGGAQQYGIAAGASEAYPHGMERVLRPGALLDKVSDLPYLLSGGIVVPIAIDTADRRANMQADGLVPGVPIPVMSLGGSPSPAPQPSPTAVGFPNELSAVAPWLTDGQRAQLTGLFQAIFPQTPDASASVLPDFRLMELGSGLPLSLHQDADKPANGDKDKGAKDKGDVKEPEKEPKKEDAPPPPPPVPAPDVKPDAGSALMTKPAAGWSLAEGRDFLSGTQAGTAITSKGRLVVSPGVRALCKIGGMLPWRIAATTNGVYVIGWGSNALLRVEKDGGTTQIFPSATTPANGIDTLTALTADDRGNLLVACWPDHRVLLLSPTGKLLHEWTLPDAIVWDLLVTPNGRRFAAGNGELYRLRDDVKTEVEVACRVADKTIYCLTAGANNTIYLATAPRGRVYRLSGALELSAVYESRDSVSSLTTDAKGNLYIGTSPGGEIVRILADGTRARIAVGVGDGKQHVTALEMVGDDLYATTAPSGGIYRIQGPASMSPEITAIYAREDQRTGASGSVGAESVMVNALAISPAGDLYAAASTPGQVLTLASREKGEFISAVIPTPLLATWGAVDVRYTAGGKPVVAALTTTPLHMETRSGFTAAPDATWSEWSELKEGRYVTSPPASYTQVRLSLDNAPDSVAVEYVRAQYRLANQPPTVKLQAPTPGTCWNGKKEIRWNAQDPDGDELTYMLSYSADGAKWTEITPEAFADKPASDRAADKPATVPDTKPAADDAGKKPDAPKKTDEPVKPAPVESVYAAKAKSLLTTPSFMLNTAKIPDGAWRFKVVASDRYAHPKDGKSAEAISGVIIIDNTSPTISLADKVEGWEQAREFTVTDNLTPVAGGKFRIDNGPWIALEAADGVFGSLSERVSLLLPDDLPALTAGEHRLEILAQDGAGNTETRTITVVIK